MQKKTADAVEILERRYIKGDKKREAELEEERLHARVARQIYDLRCLAGLSQRELAEKLGTTQSVISRLEDADYEGHSLSMLRRVADALGARVDVDLQKAEPDIGPFAFRMLLHYLRRSKGLTLSELSEEINVPEAELAAIEQQEGHRPSPRTLHKLGRFYGLPSSKLASLAGGIRESVDEVREPAYRFAAQSESFSKLSAREQKALDEFVRALREDGTR